MKGSKRHQEHQPPFIDMCKVYVCDRCASVEYTEYCDVGSSCPSREYLKGDNCSSCKADTGSEERDE